MGVALTKRRAQHGFTMVELLVVITIIGLLVGLTTAAVIAARAHVQRSTIKMDADQVAQAMEAYKTDMGAYPPDCSLLAAGVASGDTTLQAQGRAEIVRHLRKAFPKYTAAKTDVDIWNRFSNDLNQYGLNANALDPAGAIVLFLGGVPQTTVATDTIPAGFNSDPANPFSPGSSRKPPFFSFKPDRFMTPTAGKVYYKPPYLESPYVYFRARKEALPPPGGIGGTGRYEYGINTGSANLIPLWFDTGTWGICVPYLDGELTKLASNQTVATIGTQRVWRNQDSVQIITAGVDNMFGGTDRASDIAIRVSKTGENFSANNADFDNITSFSQGRLEDEIK